ncbi:MAG: GNAT family N-acetyltransferase [Acidobacteria bacterium]|jgi:ribosomal protein S18 acetylase RimI-like enzyme|nr:GNAT family N-acetyltransferase [Acidobacteriota bacterium]
MIIQAETSEQIEEARLLFREYEAWLGVDLCFQSFEEELKNLPGEYAQPSGRLFLALSIEKVAGCIALRKLGDTTCEIKRLFVRPDFRGLRLGQMLIEKALAEAKAIGYLRVRLDTLPDKMPKAVELYQSYGFREIPPYYENPHKETLFMEKEL